MRQGTMTSLLMRSLNLKDQSIVGNDVSNSIKGEVHVVAENTGVPRVPQLLDGGESDGRPDVDVKANQCWSIPDEVDGVRCLKAQEGPDQSRAWAEYGEVCRVLKRVVAPRTNQSSGNGLVM